MKMTIEVDSLTELFELASVLGLLHPPTLPAGDRPVEILGLTVRSANCLKTENIYTLAELCAHTENDLLRIPNTGRKSLNEIKKALAALGLTLKVIKHD